MTEVFTMKPKLLNKSIKEEQGENDKKLNHFINYLRFWYKHKEYYLQFQSQDY